MEDDWRQMKDRSRGRGKIIRPVKMVVNDQRLFTIISQAPASDISCKFPIFKSLHTREVGAEGSKLVSKLRGHLFYQNSKGLNCQLWEATVWFSTLKEFAFKDDGRVPHCDRRLGTHYWYPDLLSPLSSCNLGNGIGYSCYRIDAKPHQFDTSGNSLAAC